MKSNIAIVQHGSSESYAPLGWRINKLYCERHGYDHVVIPLPDSIWAKVTLLKETLPHYDAVLSLDNDAFVVDHSRPLELSSKPFVCGVNSLTRNRIFNPATANVGVTLAHRCRESLELVDLWWRHRDSGLNDQDAFNTLVVPTGHVEILGDFGGRDGTFIRHLLLMPPWERSCLLQAWLCHLVRRSNGNSGNPECCHYHKQLADQHQLCTQSTDGHSSR